MVQHYSRGLGYMSKIYKILPSKYLHSSVADINLSNSKSSSIRSSIADNLDMFGLSPMDFAFWKATEATEACITCDTW